MRWGEWHQSKESKNLRVAKPNPTHCEDGEEPRGAARKNECAVLQWYSTVLYLLPILFIAFLGAD